jgi:protein O-mannosyl-transferase
LRSILPILFVLAASVLAFADRFPNRFCWDDSLFQQATDPVLQAGFDLRTTHTGLYRPLRVFAYTEVFGWSGPEEHGFHVFATIVHAIATLALYGLLRAMRLAWPVLGALLFAVHPIHVESVVFITASFDQIAVALYLASLSAFVLAQRTGRPGWGVVALCGCALALLGSEFAATLPLAAALLALLLSRRDGLAVPGKLLAALFGLLAAYLVVRFVVIGLGARNPDVLGGSRLSAAATTAVIFVRYLGLLLWPWPSCPLQSPAIYGGFLSPPAAASALVLLGLGAASAMALRRGSALGVPFLFFGLALLPVSNLIPSTTPMAERYLYLASTGLAMLVACLRPRRALFLPAGLVLAAFWATGWERTKLWRDDLSLFGWAVRCAPGNASAWNNLGLAQLEAGQPQAARDSVEHALGLKADDSLAWTNLGRSLEGLGQDALDVYRLGIERSGGSPELEVALSGALLRQRRAPEAETSVRSALQRFPEVAELWGNLGEALLRQSRPEEAREALEQGLRRAPRHPELWTTLAEAELALGRSSEALASLERATALPRPSARAEFNLGVLLEAASPARAAAHFRRYLELVPGAADALEVRARIQRLTGSPSPSQEPPGAPPEKEGTQPR